MDESDVEAREDDGAPFPSLRVTQLYAYATSALTVPVVAALLGGWEENRSADREDPGILPASLFLAGLVTAWLAYIWTQQGHFNHATASFVVSGGLVVAALLLAVA